MVLQTGYEFFLWAKIKIQELLLEVSGIISQSNLWFFPSILCQREIDSCRLCSCIKFSDIRAVVEKLRFAVICYPIELLLGVGGGEAAGAPTSTGQN